MQRPFQLHSQQIIQTCTLSVTIKLTEQLTAELEKFCQFNTDTLQCSDIMIAVSSVTVNFRENASCLRAPTERRNLVIYHTEKSALAK
jgi:hypothetical protein